MNEEIAHRKQEGEELLREHLKKAEGMAGFFLAALKGFRRDLGLSTQSYPDNLDSDLPALPGGLAIPPMPDANGFSDLGRALLLCDAALDGKIRIKNPKIGPDHETRDKVLEEAKLAHKNLMDMADTAHRLYQCIQTAGFEFDVFNTKNIEVGRTDLNILFDRDAVYMAAATARALGERAVRLDIDLVEGIQNLESGQKQIRI